MSDARANARRLFLLLSLALLVAGPLSCFRKPADNDGPAPAIDPAATAGAARVLGVIPAFTLTDQHGEPFGTSDMYGKLCIVNFIFTRCTATCPEQTERMAELQESLQQDAESWKDTMLLSITVDPEYDTPEVLQTYAEQAGADPEHWRFLTGPREAIWNLCRDGFKLPVAAADGSGPITHSPRFAVVDPYYRIRGYFELLDNKETDDLLAAVRRIMAARFPFPPEVLATPWLEERGQREAEALAGTSVFRDFTFAHRRQESGIRFRHRIVDDAGKRWKPVHYDHGNGVAAADVDGDGLIDLYFTTQVGRNELWKNLGDGKFRDITAEAGVALEGPIGVTASFADIDNDGDPDLYATTVRGGNYLFVNDGSGHFEDITTDAGLAYSGHSSAAVFFDYDRDGLLDLFLTNVGVYTTEEVATVTPLAETRDSVKETQYYVGYPDAFGGHLKPERSEQSILYRNLGGNRFQDVSEEVGLQDVSWSGDATPIDINDDGWQDLYVLSMQGDDECYINQAGKSFERRSRELFPDTPWGSMGVKAFDYDNDGDQDLFLTDMHSDMSTENELGPDPAVETAKAEMLWPESFTQSGGDNIWGNALFRNDGNGVFSEVSDELGVENYWPWGHSVGDLNADGYTDIFIASSMNFPYRYGVNSVLLNDRGQKFFETAFALGVEPRRDRRTAAPWFEENISNLGGPNREQILELYEERMAGQQTDGNVVVWASIGSRSAIIFDLDRDGDLDIVTNEFNTEPLVLISDLAQRKPTLSYLQVQLVGSTSNRDGLGAVVQVRAAGGSYSKVHDGQSGYLAQSLCPLYFGLADAAQVDSILVKWPSGVEQTIEGPVETNQLLKIVEQE